MHASFLIGDFNNELLKIIWKAGTDIETERQISSMPWFAPPKSTTSRAEPGQARPKYLSHYLLFPSVCFIRKLDWKQSVNLNPGTLICNVGVPSGILTTAPNALLLLFLKNMITTKVWSQWSSSPDLAFFIPLPLIESDLHEPDFFFFLVP